MELYIFNLKIAYISYSLENVWEGGLFKYDVFISS